MASTINADNGVSSGSAGLKSTADSSGVLSLQTNGTTAVTVDTSQNVGIGTSTPGAKLHVAGNNNGILASAAAGTAAALYIAGNGNTVGVGSFDVYQDSSSNAVLYQRANAPLITFVNGAERMRIDSSGNVGIGTSSPATPLTLGNNRTLSWLNSAGSYNGTSTGAQILKFSDNNLYIDNLDGGAMIFRRSSGPTETMRLTGAGEMWVASTTDQGAYNIQCGGTGVWGAGAYVNGSDARIKDNIAPLQSGLDTVAKLNPVTFQYKESWSKDTSTQPGFIAQELQTALADTNYVDGVVKQGGEYMSVSYQTLIPVLVKAIQELHAKVQALESQLAAKG